MSPRSSVLCQVIGAARSARSRRPLMVTPCDPRIGTNCSTTMLAATRSERLAQRTRTLQRHLVPPTVIAKPAQRPALRVPATLLDLVPADLVPAVVIAGGQGRQAGDAVTARCVGPGEHPAPPAGLGSEPGPVYLGWQAVAPPPPAVRSRHPAIVPAALITGGRAPRWGTRRGAVPTPNSPGDGLCWCWYRAPEPCRRRNARPRR